MTEQELRPNVPLLRKAVEWVEHEARKPAIDREWHQASWRADSYDMARSHAIHMVVAQGKSPFCPEREQIAELLEPHCGTAYCVAGYVSQITDERYKHTDDVFMPDHPDADGDGEVHASRFAARELGLTPRQADHLFAATNTAADVRTIAEDIAGEAL